MSRTGWLFSFALLAGCRQIAGVDDVSFDASAAAAGNEGGGSAGVSGDIGGSAGAAGGSGGGAGGHGTEAAGTGASGAGAGSAGCAADVASDSVNCGHCGHDCLGGGCVKGVCQPHLITVTDVTPLGFVAEPARDGLLYWSNFKDGKIRSLPKQGAGPVSVRFSEGDGPISHLALDGTALFYLTYSDSSSAPNLGLYGIDTAAFGPAALLAGGYLGAWAVATSPTDIYFTTRFDYREVVRVPRAGGAPHSILTSPLGKSPVYDGPLALALDATHLFVAMGAYQGGAPVLLRMKLDGSELQVFDDAAPFTNVVDDGASVYWVKNDALQRRPVDGSAPAATIAANGPIYELWVTSDKICWTTSGAVHVASKDGTGEVSIPADATQYGTSTGDAQSFYWITQQGNMYGLAL